MTEFRMVIIYIAIGICVARFVRWMDREREDMGDGDYYVSIAMFWPLAVVILGVAAIYYIISHLILK